MTDTRNRYPKNPNDNDDFFSQFDNENIQANRSSRGASASRSANASRRTNASRGASAPRDERSPRYESASVTRRRSGGRRSSAGASYDRNRRPAPDDRRETVSGRSGSRPAPPVNPAKRKPKKHSPVASVFKVIGLLVLACVMGVGIYVGIIFATAPKVETDDLYSQLAQRSIMYDSEGNNIENLYFEDGNRTVVSYDEIPDNMINAVIAVEDRKFWKHNGFNFVRMLGAIRDSIFGGGEISGTSTVTQQLARNIYLAEIKSQRSLSRKISEMYCTIVLEKNLTKKEIMEAYLNTIYLGFNSYGVQAAAQSYFSKDVQDLDVLECASLAALPQSPDVYALIKADYYNTNTSLPVISKVDSVNYLYNGDITKDRRDRIITSMCDQNFISTEEKDAALKDDLKDHMKLPSFSSGGMSSYFADFAIDQLTDDIVAEYGISRADAQNMIYTGGLKIYTTLDTDIQKSMEKEFKDSDNFAGVAYVRTDSDGNLLGDDGELLLYDYDYYFNDDDEFTLKSSEYSMESDGSMKILAGKRLNIYETEVNGEPDVSIEFKGMYTRDDGIFYFIESGALSIPQGYKSVDGDGNVIISAQFFDKYPDFFVKSGKNYVVKSDNYTLKQKTRQPQAAAVIMENSTGQIKAMMGGRGTSGKQLYNRATATRQPGSSIKPIAVYGPAIQMSYEYEKDGKTMSLDTSEGSNWGRYITAGSVINDAPINVNGRNWPKNSYGGYRGQMTLRTAVQQSVNVCAVKTYQQIGPDYASSMLKKVGITSLDDEGEVNDLNPAALALGGMTNGISPLELTAAYATFPNGGIYKSPIAYTKVLNSKDETLFEKSSEGERVYNEGVAWIMTDILRTVVTRGIAGSAAIGSQPVGGKTGTTDNNYDAWFAGFTPQYTMALWMGNDMNIELTSGSAMSARFWSHIMSDVCDGLEYGSFRERPSNVISVGGEYYTDGTYSRVAIRKSQTKTKATKKETKATTTKSPTEDKPQTPAENKPQTPAENKPQTPAEDKPQTPAEDKPQTPAENNGTTS